MADEENAEEEEVPEEINEEKIASGLSGLDKTRDGKSVVMTKLDLPSMKLGDLTPLALLSHVRHIDVSGNLIKDLTPVLALTELLSLNASGNKIEGVTLPEMPYIQLLDLSNNQIKGPFTCPSMPHLRHLLLAQNEIDAATGLDQNTQLQKLELHQNKLTQCDGIGLESVRQLTLHNNELTSVAGLEKLKFPTAINLTGNQLASMEEVVKAMPESVVDLDVQENPLMEAEFDRVKVVVLMQRLKMLNAAPITEEEAAAADLIINPPPAEEEAAPA
uniref:Uncharacterized protein n=1 Tax=Hemiselmis andersenii TaxID=464988 RepID=A0A6T8P0K3_HEMAN|mmetsp:Transcript_7063/g.16165  ORF Transcript_7063/g.16165 Transcript_7063/m.16165 type:complete len:275 (+) Transcript_7063:91-915(+)|eukprot:CAMPEP_0114125812 /NCGR_PEP_ID=MMETSP0043_2-20121206/9496_1 /TAXON_ID=464988 /ORGANISM="Hemiselmis andersenii, Strain CCMP644" /LENGTH=274 /DNA_ID=CAMNT_0001218755 /DNA_START=88 /DNA_END=912 /DNA_ORIENTATION=+